MTYYERVWDIESPDGHPRLMSDLQFAYCSGHKKACEEAALIAHEADQELEKMKIECKDLKVELAETMGDLMSVLGLLADIREACGDNGKRMQPELVEYIRELKGKTDADDNWWKGEGWYEGMEGVGEEHYECVCNSGEVVKLALENAKLRGELESLSEQDSFTKFTSETSLTSGKYYDILTSDMDFPQKALLTHNGDFSLVARGGIVNMSKVTHYKGVV